VAIQLEHLFCWGSGQPWSSCWPASVEPAHE
jgi:hypothetical protein